MFVILYMHFSLLGFSLPCRRHKGASTEPLSTHIPRANGWLAESLLSSDTQNSNWLKCQVPEVLGKSSSFRPLQYVLEPISVSQQQQIDAATRAYAAKGTLDSWPKPWMEKWQLHWLCMKSSLKYKISSTTRRRKTGWLCNKQSYLLLWNLGTKGPQMTMICKWRGIFGLLPNLI